MLLRIVPLKDFKQYQAGAELCQAQFKLGLDKRVLPKPKY
jgi:hypothetical protein